MSTTAPASRAAPDPARATPLRDLTAYLRGIRVIVAGAAEAHKIWVRELGRLLLEARGEGPDVLAAAPAVAEAGRAAFTPWREQLAALRAPAQVETCHWAVTAWLDKHLAACDQLLEAHRTGQVSELRAVHGIMGDARRDMAVFRRDYTRLVTELKRYAATRRPKAK